ncbi:MAG: septum formation initiator family protein [Pseudomonadota bacterium]
MKKRLLIVAWVVIFFFLLLCIIFGEKGTIDLYHLKSESDRLTGVTDDLKKENQDFYRNVKRLKDDPEYIEEVAREEFGMVARDEIIYQFKGEKEAKKK